MSIPLRPSACTALLFFSLMAAAPMPATAQAGTAIDRQAKLNGGYYLFHHLCEDEDQLLMILVVKHAPEGIAVYVDKISRMAKASLATLEKFQDKDRAIEFDKNPLPQIEQDVRDSIKDDKQHQLLFGTRDAEFVRALLVSQIEATTYGRNLCSVLADQETDPARSRQLRKISDQWLGMRDEAFRLLRNY